MIQVLCILLVWSTITNSFVWVHFILFIFNDHAPWSCSGHLVLCSLLKVPFKCPKMFYPVMVLTHTATSFSPDNFFFPKRASRKRTLSHQRWLCKKWHLFFKILLTNRLEFWTFPSTKGTRSTIQDVGCGDVKSSHCYRQAESLIHCLKTQPCLTKGYKIVMMINSQRRHVDKNCRGAQQWKLFTVHGPLWCGENG